MGMEVRLAKWLGFVPASDVINRTLYFSSVGSLEVLRTYKSGMIG